MPGADSAFDSSTSLNRLVKWDFVWEPDCAARGPEEPSVNKILFIGSAVCVAVLLAIALAWPRDTRPPHGNGLIAFEQFDAANRNVIATVNPDGSGVDTVLDQSVECPHWSPDGSRIAVCGGASDEIATTIVTVDSGAVVTWPSPDPRLSMDCFVWSPTGKRLACSSYNERQPRHNGIYSVRASDGQGLRRVTSASGGSDVPSSYSRNGKRLAFVRFDDHGPVGLFVVNVDGTQPRRITPRGALIDGTSMGDWSRLGIVFAMRSEPGTRPSLWVVHPDGSGLREIDFGSGVPCGGRVVEPTSTSCFDATWSPDGLKLAFVVTEPGRSDARVFTANADGSEVTVVTAGDSRYPDWGPHPLN